jgi:hypothetical protein
MASIIQALRALAPRFTQRKTLTTHRVASGIGKNLGLKPKEVKKVLAELATAVEAAARAGQTVHLRGLGSFIPHFKIEQGVKLNFRPEKQLTQKGKDQGFVQVELENEHNRGRSIEEICALWNSLYPDDPVMRRGQKVSLGEVTAILKATLVRERFYLIEEGNSRWYAGFKYYLLEPLNPSAQVLIYLSNLDGTAFLQVDRQPVLGSAKRPLSPGDFNQILEKAADFATQR